MTGRMRQQRIANLLAGDVVANDEVLIRNCRLIFQRDVSPTIVRPFNDDFMRVGVQPIDGHARVKH